MATNKYISLDNLSTFLENIKDIFATKEEIDIVESLALVNKTAIEANTSALETMRVDIEDLASRIRANEEALANFVAISSQEVNDLFE